MSRGWAKASACRLQVSRLVLSSAISCCSSICPGRLSTAWLVSLVVFSCHMVSPSGGTRGPSVVFEAVDMPCPGPFHFSHSVDYSYDFCPLPDPDVSPSIFICDVEHSSFYFGQCGSKFVLCVFGQCPGLCTISNIDTFLCHVCGRLRITDRPA